MAAAKTTGKDVAVPEPKNNLPAAYDYGDAAGSGFEDMDSSHVAVPFLNLLQAMSPQVVDSNPPGAKAGLVLNSVTQDLMDEFEIIPSAIEHCYVEWVPKAKGGGGGAGFVGVHALKSEIVEAAKRAPNADRNKLQTPDGNDLVETFYVYGIVTDLEGTILGPGIIAFTSTKIKVYKGWSTKVNLFPHRKFGFAAQPPLFAHRIKIGVAKQENKKGKFFNFTAAPAVNGTINESLLEPTDPRFVAAMGLRDMVKQGQAKAAFETQDAGVATSENADPEEPPF